ncbi:MAG: carboxypeptidase-like regulatory domain-containing protein [Candidatus Acidiferrales bacterium]
MNRFCSRILLSIFVAFFLAAAVYAGTIHGTVINRTTGKPTPGIPVTLLNPTAGMVEVGSATSDAQGQFTVTSDAIGIGPVLIRATYHDNSFNTFLPPGRPTVEVEIFETSKDPKSITPDSHIIIFQPSGEKLIGAEEYHVLNKSNPPVAYFRAEGNFDFAIPDKATLQQVSTISSLGMAVPQASIDKGKGRFAIAYPFRPGGTSIRLSYELAYPGNAAALKLPATYAGLKMLIVAPPGVTVSGDGLNPAGQEQGMMVYTHEPLAAKTSFTVQLSGIGNPQAAEAGGNQGQEPGQEGNSRAQEENVEAVPGRLDDFKWILMIGLAALFALGALLLSRKQVVVDAVPAADLEDAPAPPRKSSGKPAKSAATPPATTVADVNAQVNASLDSLKDAIFRLELRKQAGTISADEYAQERAKVEKLLRDLVQG